MQSVRTPQSPTTTGNSKKIEKASLLSSFNHSSMGAEGDNAELGSADGYASTVNSIDLLRCSPGMADLFRRLYQIRIDCGEIVGDGLDKQRQIEMQEFQKKLKKLDKFERQKGML